MKQTRNTPQKALVLGLIRENFSHPTADDIYELSRQQDPRISLGTVYRNLNTLAEAGEIRRLPMPTGPDHYDCNLENHYHFLCRTCNKVVDVNLPYKTALNIVSPGLAGYKTEWHRLVLVGLCNACNN